MNENNQLKAFVAFLFIFSVLAVSQTFAASVVSPVVPGYSAGRFAAAAGSYTMTAANDGYIKPSIVNVGGKAITVPASLRMAANAGQFAKNAIRLNPGMLLGTLAAGYLLDQGIEYYQNNWTKTVPYSPPGATTCEDAAGGAAPECTGWWAPMVTHWIRAPASAPGCVFKGNASWAYTAAGFDCGMVAPSRVPADDTDWAGLPDPLPAIAPELPHAPYMPEGGPVDAPDFNFAPFSTPVGDPYTKPDGSTHQPMATVSPNGDKVTIDTYDQPVNDPQGNPVPNPTPSDTPEPTPNHCEQNPETIGCSQYGSAGAAETIPTTSLPATVSVTPVGGSGTCPADVVTSRFGITWSYQPICDFASAVRPFVLGFAWLSFAFVVAGAVRT